jgi:hypothetical protein
MGGNPGRRASEAAAGDLKKLVDLSAQFEKNMGKAADHAEKTSRVASRRASIPSMEQIGAGGGRANPLIGGGASMPVLPGRTGRDIAAAAYARGAPAGMASPVASSNGGGARMPMTPGSGTAGMIPGLGGVDSAGEIPSGSVPSFGEMFGGVGRAVGGFALGAAASAFTGLTSAGAVSSFRSADYLANRAALASGGSYNKQGAANNLLGWAQNSFRNDAERNAFVMPLLRGGGQAGSAQFNTVAAASRGIAQRDPMAAATASQVQLGLGTAQMFNTARMMGIQTLDPGGAPRSLGNIVQQLSAMMSTGEKNPNAVPSAARVGDTFVYGRGRMRIQLQKMGMSEDQINAAQTYMQNSSKAGKWLPDTVPGKAGDTMLGADQGAASGKTDALTAALKQYSDGYITAQKAITSGMVDLANTIKAMPDGIKEALFGTAGAGGAAKHGGGLPSGTGTAALAGGALVAKRVWSAVKGTGSKVAEEGAPVVEGAGGLLGKVGRVGGDALGLLGAAESLIGAGRDINYGVHHGGRPPKPKGAWWQFWKGNDYGDGPGRVAIGSSTYPGVVGGSFRGKEWGDGPGSANAQADAAKARGGETFGILEELMKGFPGGAKVSSTVRHGQSGVTVSGNVSYHATGNAVDFTANTPGVDSPQLLAINKYLAQFAPGLNELIYAGPGATLIKDGRQVSSSFYGKDVMDIHHNHVHVAATAGMLKNLKSKGKGKGFFSRMLGGIESLASSAVSGIEHLFGGGKAKPSTKSGSGPTSRGGSSSLGVNLLRAAATGSMSQAGLIDQLLHNLGPAFGTSMGSHRTVVDPTEAATSAGSSTARVGGPAPKATGGHYDIHQLAQLARSVGFRGEHLVDAVSVALAESGGYITEVSQPNADQWGSRDKGLWQINDHWHSEVKDPLDPLANARAAFRISDGGANWGPWSTWHNGSAAKERPTVTKGLSKAEIGDGPGRAMSQTADVPTPMAHTGGGVSGGNINLHSRGGSSVRIGKVEVHLTTQQVSQAEAKRIGKMVVDEIATQARMREMSH